MDEHATLARDTAALADNTFDLLVIGGGIHGLAIAYDAAARGLATALVDRGDFGAGASFNHQKTAHGGLRSLQSGDLRRARESVVERRTLARIAPRLLRPLPFMIATYRTLMRSRTALRVGFTMDRAIARDRNNGIEPELRLPAPRLVSRPAVERLFPGVRREGLTGGATWYDYQIVESDRLTAGVALAAASHGAVLVNYLEAVAPIKDAAGIVGFRVRDTLTAREFDVRARLTLNAAGSHAGSIMRSLGVRREFPLLRAMNLVTNRRAGDLALAAPTNNGRMLTMTPWRGIAVVGTSQSAWFVTDGDEPPSDTEVSAFIADANEAFPALKLTPETVTLVHRGIVPAEKDRRGRPTLKRHAEVLDHSRDGVAGAMTVVGVKYTTARAVAQRAVDAAMKKLGKHGHRCSTATTILPGASIADHEALAIETEHRLKVTLPDAVRARLTTVYGARCVAVIEIAAADRTLLAPIAADSPIIGAEVAHAIRHEAARHLEDVVMRRCGFGAGSWPGDAIAARTAEIAALELEWTEAQRALEIRTLRERYRVVGPA
jgi:glycerol-3-phosphate dehydrogenase